MRTNPKQKLAKLFLILSFPFWFPRMVFWMVYEFICYQLPEWIPPKESKKSQETGSLWKDPMENGANRSSLKLVQGNPDLPHWHKLKSKGARPKLKVLVGGAQSRETLPYRVRARK